MFQEDLPTPNTGFLDKIRVMAVSGHQDIYGGDEGLRHHLCLSHGEHLDEGASREHMEDLHEDEHGYNPGHRGEWGCPEHGPEDEPTEFHDMHESGGIGEIHRGIGVSLPDRVHKIVHDPSRSIHERAQALLGHVSDHPDHWGMHWTTTSGVAEDFAERSAQHEANEDQRGRYALDDFTWGHEQRYKDTPLGKPGTAVVFHAHEPSLDAIENDGHRLSNGGAYGWSEHGEHEVPIRDTHSLDLKGISWAPMHSDDEVPGHGEYTHHDFGHEHTAAVVAHFEAPPREYSAGRMLVSDIRRPGEGKLSERPYTQGELAADIRANGVQQPLAIEHLPVHGGPTSFNGLHRLDAAEQAGVADVPVVVKHLPGEPPPMTGRRPSSENEFNAVYNLERAGHWAGEHTAALDEDDDYDHSVPPAERTESVRHMLDHYKPYDFPTWKEVSDNNYWDHPVMRAFVDHIRQHGVQRPIPVDYEQDPPMVRNGHTRLLAAERAGRTHVPARQWQWMDPDDEPDLPRLLEGHESKEAARAGDEPSNDYKDHHVVAHSDDERPFGYYTLRHRTEDLGERKPRHFIDAHTPEGTVVGRMNWFGTTGWVHHIDVGGEEDDSVNGSSSIGDGREHQGRGLATAMWDWSQEMRPKAKHSKDQTNQGKAWVRNLKDRPRREAPEGPPPGQVTAAVVAHFEPEAAVPDPDVDLYHHTSPETAAKVHSEKRMTSKENTGSIFFTTDPDSEYAAGFGDGVVHVRMPQSHLEAAQDRDHAWQDDEFPSGEQHWAIHHSELRPEHFVDPSVGRREAASPEEYGMSHRPDPTGPPLHDLSEGDMMPRDFYDRMHEYNLYSHDGGLLGEAAYQAERKIRLFRGKPEKKVTIWRSAPAVNPESRNAKRGEINHGDWVGLSSHKALAESYEANDPPSGSLPANHPSRYHIWSARVPAKHVRNPDGDTTEWGYFGPDVKDIPHVSEQCSHRARVKPREAALEVVAHFEEDDAGSPGVAVEHHERPSGGASYPHMHVLTATHPDGTTAELRYMLSKRNSRGVVDHAFLPGGYADSLGKPLVQEARRLHPGTFVKGLPGIDEDWGKHLPSVTSLHRNLTVNLEPADRDFVHDESVPKAERARFLMDHMARGGPSMHWASQRGRAAAEQSFGDHEFRSPEHTQIAINAAPPSPEHVETDPERISRNGGYAYQAPDWEVPLKEGAPVTVSSVRWRTGNTGWTHHQFKGGHQFTAGRSEAGTGFETWFHGTGDQAAREIQQHGLTSRQYGVADYSVVRMPNLTTSRDEAARYAVSRTGPAGKLSGQEPSVVELHIPAHLSDEYLAREDPPDYAGLHKPVPPSMIHSVSPADGSRREEFTASVTVTAAEYGSKPEFQGAPDHLSDDEKMEHWDQQRRISKDWESHVLHGISTGELHPDRAKELGYYFDGHQTDDQGRHKWQPLPQHLYHVTTNLPGVREHGLKSRRELEQERGGHGLGGGPDDTISLTDDHDVAKNILRAVHEFHGVVNGRYTPAQMWEDAKAGKGAPRPFHEDLAGYHQPGWKDGDPLPRRVDSAVRGKELKTGGLVHSPQEMAESEGPGWTPHHESSELTGGDGVKRYNVWERDLNPDERRAHAADFYKNFAAYRSWAGGHEDPLFFSTDTKAFAAKDPKDFAIVHARPRPGAMGHQVSALGEWRTGTGDALETHRAERLEGGHLKEAAVSLASRFQPGFPNPQTGGDEWFHGTHSDPGDFVHGFSHDDSPSHEEEEMRGHLSHWNTLLGSHFAADHGVAEHFARMGASTHDSDEDDFEGGDPGSRYRTRDPQSVIHARLHLANPKHYDSEFDMDHEAYEHEYGEQKNYISKHFEDGYEDEDPSHEDYDPETPGEGEEWPLAARYRHDDKQPIGRDEMHKPGLFEADTPHPERTRWLNSHPDKAGISRRFKERLQAQGHDGILYGNEFERGHATGHGDHHDLSAIIFRPHQAEITQHHQTDTPCLSREEGEHQRGRMPQPGQEELPGVEEHADGFPNGFLKGAALVAHFEEPRTAAGPYMQQKLFHMQPDPTLHEPESGRHNPEDPEGHLHWRKEHDEGYQPDECPNCGGDRKFRERHAEEHESWLHDQDWHTDWDAEGPAPGDQMHRGMATMLPQGLHDRVHDASVPVAQRARELAHHVVSGGGLGNFWSSDPDVSKSYAESTEHHLHHRFPKPNGEAHDQTPVMVHAKFPGMEHVETDPEQLDYWGVHSYHKAGNREIPIQHQAPLHVTGISWGDPGHGGKMTYDGPEHAAGSEHLEDDPHWTHHEFGGDGIRANASAAVVAHFEEGPLPEYHGEPLYHGTRSILEPGEHLTVEEAGRHPNNPDIQTDPYVHATTDPREAHRWGERAKGFQAERRHRGTDRERRIGPGQNADHAYRPRVYEVHPTGHVAPDLEYADTEHDSWRSAHPMRVKREVEPLTCYDCPDSGGNEEHWPDHPHYEYLRQQADEDEADREERGRTAAIEDAPQVPSFTWKYQTYGPNGGYTDAEREVAGPFYHGSRSKGLRPGSQVKKGMPTNPWGDEGDRSKFVHFTTDLGGAATYARQAGGHVYEVEPTGDVKGGYTGNEWKSEHPLRVIRRVPGDELGSATAAVVAHFEDDDEDPDDYSANDEWDEDAPPEKPEDEPEEESVAHRSYRLPYMTKPPEGELIDHLHHHHGLDARTSDLYMNAKDRERWHDSAHRYKTNSTHQHDHPQGAPGEEHWPDVFQLSEHTDFPGGTRGDWNRVPGHTAPFKPLRSSESVSLPEVTAVHPEEQRTALPQNDGEMWSHLQEAHGARPSAGSDKTPSADFVNALHRRFHNGKSAFPGSVPHQHEGPGSPPASGQSAKDYISRMFTPIPPDELEAQRRAREPKPERLDDREYSLRDVSRHYDWEGFSSHEIEHLVHRPERAAFTKEDVPVKSLRHIDEHGNLVHPPSYRDIAGQGDDERERLEELARGYDQGDPVPPIVAVRDGEHHIIADGSHRAAVHAERGSTHIPAFVTQRTVFPEEHTAAVTAAYDWSTDEGPFEWSEIGDRHPHLYGEEEIHGHKAEGADGFGIGDAAAHLYYDRPEQPYDETYGGLHPSAGAESSMVFHPRTVEPSRIDYARSEPGDPRVRRAREGYESQQPEKVPPLILVHRHGVFQPADGHHRAEGADKARKPVRAYVAYSPHENEPFSDGERAPYPGASTEEPRPWTDSSTGEPARRISYPGFPHTADAPRPQAHEAALVAHFDEPRLVIMEPVNDVVLAPTGPLAAVVEAARVLGSWEPESAADLLRAVHGFPEVLAALRNGVLRVARVTEELPVHPDVADMICDMARSLLAGSEDTAVLLRNLPPEASCEESSPPNR